MRMEYVRKTGLHDIFTTTMCKLSRRIFKKIEVMQARHHMKDATNITLPSQKCPVISGISKNWKQYNVEINARCNHYQTAMLKASNHELLMWDTQQQYFDVRTWYDR